MVNKKKSKTSPNYIYSILGVALVLFLIGFFGLMIWHAQRLVTHYKEKVEVLIELKEEVGVAQLDTFQNKLGRQTYVKPQSVTFTSKEEALELMKQEEFGEELLNMDLPNPFYDVVTFNVLAAYLEPDKLRAIKLELKTLDFVSDVYYEEGLVENMKGNIQKIGYLALGISVFFLFIALTLIHNTIRLAMYSNRFLIKNMQLVGASWRFISRPYLLTSIRNGFISSIIAITALSILLYIIYQDIPELQMLQNNVQFMLTFGFLLLLGIGITSLSTYFTVNKYLNMRIDDLY